MHYTCMLVMNQTMNGPCLYFKNLHFKNKTKNSDRGDRGFYLSFEQTFSCKNRSSVSAQYWPNNRGSFCIRERAPNYFFFKFWCRARHSFYLFCNFSYDTFFLGMFSCWAFFLPELGT